MFWYSTTISQHEFLFISDGVALPLNTEVIDIGIFWIPLVASCQTIKPKEHFYNRTLVTMIWEINRESETLDFVLGFASSDFQHNLGKLLFQLV